MGSESLQRAGDRSLAQRKVIEAFVDGELPVDEPFPDVKRRVLDAWRDIDGAGHESAVVVTSAVVVLIVVADVLETPIDPPRIRIDNTGVTEVLLTEDGPVLVQLNCTGHLPRELLTDTGAAIDLPRRAAVQSPAALRPLRP